ncbi:uncharacterized protein LOC127531679 [Acanthochromis polyacanthus]|uniref:uncharacterized protein LOC127531679 n=1 Tax=Acanthochromis polyacanthus TaxID=80966 RepID=UPI0022344F33|nr:uncharacterized protein LOC127531679 [Acanthochromis polyacanthus]
MFSCIGKRRKEKVSNQDSPDGPTTTVSSPAEKNPKKTWWFGRWLCHVKTTRNQVIQLIPIEDTDEIVDTGCKDLSPKIPVFEMAIAESINEMDQEVSPATTTAGTAARKIAWDTTETTEEKKTPWWRRFCHVSLSVNEKYQVSPATTTPEIPVFETAIAESINEMDQEVSPATTTAGTAAVKIAWDTTETTEEKKTPWWRRFCDVSLRL